MVGGVSPGKGGKMHLGLPVFDSVKEVHFTTLYSGIPHKDIPEIRTPL